MSDVDLVVLGGGPGGYTAAFRAADLGLSVALVDDAPRLGGVCLRVGCIPSKVLLHAARVITDAREAHQMGITFADPTIDTSALQAHTDGVIDTLAGGLTQLATRRKIEVITGQGTFVDDHTVAIDGEQSRTLTFDHAIIAVGSRPAMLPDWPDDARIIDSTGALALKEIPKHMLIVGGGIIGLEMATVMLALGSRVTVVEMTDQLIPGCDPTLVEPLQKRLEEQGAEIALGTRVMQIEPMADDLAVTVSDGSDSRTVQADRVLVAIGRTPNGATITAEAAGVTVDERGFIPVDDHLRTSLDHIHAIGDVIGHPMLAHKAAHEGRVAAEIIAGHDVSNDVRVIPSVAYTDPEIAWVGLTQTDAAANGIDHEVATIPWMASGRARTLGRPEGRTTMLVDPTSHRILGVGIVGYGAGELIAEAAVAIEMGAVAEDLALTVHPHPTLSETVGLAAEWIEGTITDLYRRPRR